MAFENRTAAGKLLARKLSTLGVENPVVLALPRGGVPIAYEIAKNLKAPFDVLVVRKIGAPGHEEFGIGAITEEGYHWVDPEKLSALQVNESDLQSLVKKEAKEVDRRIKSFREDRSLPNVNDKTVILADDGLATGVTARVGAHYLKKKGAKKVILAIPVCAPDTAKRLRNEVDEVICLAEPEEFWAVGLWYGDFEQLTDEEVNAYLRQSRPGVISMAHHRSLNSRKAEAVVVKDDNIRLPGELTLHTNDAGLVIFAHGSGSSRLSKRNQYVARRLEGFQLGTFLFDLLTDEEAADRRNVFDISLLADRLLLAVDWLKKEKKISDHTPLGFFGASTGGGAALWAAANLGEKVAAVVSRGGRPDLALPQLSKVKAPTLLIVGGNDEPVLTLNHHALFYLPHGKIKIVPGATHLFEEPGALEQVAELAGNWFSEHFRKVAQVSAA